MIDSNPNLLRIKNAIKGCELVLIHDEMNDYTQPYISKTACLFILLNVYEKTKTFVIEAGKVIFVISIVLWLMASFAPGDGMKLAEQEATSIAFEKKSIEALFNDPNMTAEEVSKKSLELQEVINALEEKEERWLELSMKLED